MITGLIRRQSDNAVLFEHARKTQTAWERMRGLLAHQSLDVDEALLISPCSSVHMFGMRYALDIAYLNKSGEVIKTVNALRPMRMSACFGADTTLEMPENSLASHNIRVGDLLLWEQRA